jgi:ABC-type lipoprotein release transport system permease subunit
MLVLAVAMGLVGGVAIAAVAAARRGGTSLDRLEAAWHVPTYSVNSFAGSPDEQLQSLRAVLNDVGVKGGRIFSVATLLTFPGRSKSFADGAGGMLTEIDIKPGRPANGVLMEGRRPVAADEVAVTQAVLRRLGLHVGDRVEVAWYHYADLETLGGGGVATPAGTRSMLITGRELLPAELLRDARAEEGTIFENNTNIGFLPVAFWEDAGPDLATYGVGAAVDVTKRQSPRLQSASAESGLVVDEGAGELQGLNAVQSAIDLESAALVGFAAILALAGVGLLGGASARMLNVDPADRSALDAVGVSQRLRLRAATLLGTGVGAIASAVAVGTAIGASTQAPIGYAAQAEISPGLDVDGPVLAIGAVVVLLVIVGAALLGALLATRVQPASSTAGRRPLGRPLPATVGLRLLGQTARSRSGTSVRVAGVIAVSGTIAAVAAWAFAGSMHHLVGSPNLQGWEWDLMAGNYGRPESAAAGAEALARNPDVEAFTGFVYQSVYIDGKLVVVAGFDGSAITPRVLDGRAPRTHAEIALGEATARRLGKKLGDTVKVGIDPSHPTHQLTLVGLITPPAGLADGMSLNRGGSTTARALQEMVATEGDGADELPPFVHLLRLKHGVDVHAAIQRLQPDFPGVVNTARPTADVRSLQRVQFIPYLLATMIGLSGVIGVVLVLAQLERRRQRELALLRCVGFTARQLLGVVLWQATAFTAAALAIGIPLGFIAGRWLWRLAADRIGTDAGTSVSVLGIALAALGAIAVANAFALGPGRRAGRVHPAVALHVE